MKQPATIPTTFTFQNHKIRTVQRNGSVWFVNADICKTLGIADSRGVLDYLYPAEMNVIDGQEINDPGELLLSIISESGMKKLVHYSGNHEAKDSILSLSHLSNIDNQNPGVTEDILSKVQALHLKALGKSNLQAVMDTMQVLRDGHPNEYAEAIQYIDRTHDFFFDYPGDNVPKNIRTFGRALNRR